MKSRSNPNSYRLTNISLIEDINSDYLWDDETIEFRLTASRTECTKGVAIRTKRYIVNSSSDERELGEFEIRFPIDEADVAPPTYTLARRASEPPDRTTVRPSSWEDVDYLESKGVNLAPLRQRARMRDAPSLYDEKPGHRYLVMGFYEDLSLWLLRKSAESGNRTIQAEAETRHYLDLSKIVEVLASNQQLRETVGALARDA